MLKLSEFLKEVLGIQCGDQGEKIQVIKKSSSITIFEKLTTNFGLLINGVINSQCGEFLKMMIVITFHDLTVPHPPP